MTVYVGISGCQDSRWWPSDDSLSVPVSTKDAHGCQVPSKLDCLGRPGPAPVGPVPGWPGPVWAQPMGPAGWPDSASYLIEGLHYWYELFPPIFGINWMIRETPNGGKVLE